VPYRVEGRYTSTIILVILPLLVLKDINVNSIESSVVVGVDLLSITFISNNPLLVLKDINVNSIESRVVVGVDLLFITFISNNNPIINIVARPRVIPLGFSSKILYFIPRGSNLALTTS
jgi:hypothetical protein